MKAELLPNGNLHLTITHAEREEWKDLAAENPDFDSDCAMTDLFDKFMANSEYDWILPEEAIALTDAPIIGTRDQDGKPEQVWGWMDYQVQSLQRALLEQGEAILITGE